MCSELPTAVEAIAALEDHCQVYVHCDNITGNYRSATVVVAYMIKYHDMLDEAIDHVQTCRREGFLFRRTSLYERTHRIQYFISTICNHGYRENREVYVSRF
jgi:protein-tyrosine phosphatase